jgi:hypothetical protein
MRMSHAEGVADLRNGAAADHRPVQRQDGAGTGRGAGAGPYGLPAALFVRLWSIDDVCEFVGVERTKARELLADPSAPPRLRTGSRRCDRWNPALVVAWLHGDDWRELFGPGPGRAGSGQPPCEAPAERGRPPGRPWPSEAAVRGPVGT